MDRQTEGKMFRQTGRYFFQTEKHMVFYRKHCFQTDGSSFQTDRLIKLFLGVSVVCTNSTCSCGVCLIVSLMCVSAQLSDVLLKTPWCLRCGRRLLWDDSDERDADRWCGVPEHRTPKQMVLFLHFPLHTEEIITDVRTTASHAQEQTSVITSQMTLSRERAPLFQSATRETKYLLHICMIMRLFSDACFCKK